MQCDIELASQRHHTGTVVALLFAVALAASACSSDDSSTAAEATTAPETTTTAAAPTLEEQITADFQGVQLDAIGGTPEPVSTTMWFQDGTSAVEGLWRSDGDWCLLNLYEWSVIDATSPTEFTVQYDRAQAFPECAATISDDQLVLRVDGTRQESGRTVYDATYLYPDDLEIKTKRTVCSATWADPDRCGIATPGLDVPNPPAG